MDILELAVPQVEVFRTAIGDRRERQALYVQLHTTDGAWGIGECSCRPDPWFNGEFVAGARAVLRDFVAPLLAQATTVGDVVDALRRLRGWPFTAAAVLDALMDLERRQGRQDLLDVWPHERLDRVPVGISLGLFPDADSAVERVARVVAEGYHRVKMKIAPTMDLEPLRAVRRRFPDLHLGFDANGSCGEASFPFLTALAALDPSVVEQPFAPDRLDLCQELRRRLPSLRVCLDESVDGLGRLVSAHRLGALDEVNVKPGRVGGPFETFRILAWCREQGLPAWVGGMFETGIGRLANLRVAARLPSATAHDLSPSRRYFSTDVLSQPLDMGDDGAIDLRGEAPPELDAANLKALEVDHLAIPLNA